MGKNDAARAPVRTRWEVSALLVIIAGAVTIGYHARHRMLLANYVAMLRSPSSFMAEEGTSKLAKLGKSAAPRLLLIARDKSESLVVRRRALKSLYDSGVEESRAAVANAVLASGDEAMQRAVLDVLDESGDAAAMPCIRRACRDSEFPDIRMKALRIYGRFPVEFTAPDLIEILQDPDVRVAMEALDALERASKQEFGNFDDSMRPAPLEEARLNAARRAKKWCDEFTSSKSDPGIPSNGPPK